MRSTAVSVTGSCNGMKHNQPELSCALVHGVCRNVMLSIRNTHFAGCGICTFSFGSTQSLYCRFPPYCKTNDRPPTNSVLCMVRLCTQLCNPIGTIGVVGKPVLGGRCSKFDWLWPGVIMSCFCGVRVCPGSACHLVVSGIIRHHYPSSNCFRHFSSPRCVRDLPLCSFAASFVTRCVRDLLAACS